MSKNLTENYPIVDTVEALEERLAGVREAQRIFATYTQEHLLPIKQEFLLQSLQLKKLVWEL